MLGLGIAAGVHISSLCDHVDLDENLLLAEDPWPGLELVDGVQLPSEHAGLGVGPRPVIGLAGPRRIDARSAAVGVEDRS